MFTTPLQQYIHIHIFALSPVMSLTQQQRYQMSGKMSSKLFAMVHCILASFGGPCPILLSPPPTGHHTVVLFFSW